MRRRIVRILPLYWIATIAVFAFHRVSSTHGAADGWRELLLSLAFPPFQSGDWTWGPSLPQGWTLNYEMMFYLLFALWLAFPRPVALTGVVAMLCAFVAVRPAVAELSASLGYLASPIILLFALGILLGATWRGFGLREPVGLAPACEPLKRFGDASYSIYLSHSVIVNLLSWGWRAAFGKPTFFLCL